MVDAEGTSFIWPKSNQPIRTGSNDGCQFFGPLISGTVSAIPVDAAKIDHSGSPMARPSVEFFIVNNIKPVVASLLACLVTTSSIHAEITVDVSKITCKEFMFDTVTLPDNIAYWLSGYYNGKRGNTVLDITALRDYVNKVEQYCLQNQDMTVMKAAETILNVNKKL